jgi:hypothetical protein
VRIEYLPVVGAAYNKVVGLIVLKIINRGMVSLIDQAVAENGLHPLKLGYLMIPKFLHAILSQALVGHVAHPHQQVLGPDEGRGESTRGELGVMAEK